MTVQLIAFIVSLCVLTSSNKFSMTDNLTDLTFTSYNSNGLGVGRIEYIEELLKKTRTLASTKSNIFPGNNLSNLCVYGVSGMSERNLVTSMWSPIWRLCYCVGKKALNCTLMPLETT